MQMKLAGGLLLLSVAAAALVSTTQDSSDGISALRAENARLRHEDAAKTAKIAGLNQANSALEKEVAAQNEKIAAQDKKIEGLNQGNSALRKLAIDNQAKKAELKESAPLQSTAALGAGLGESPQSFDWSQCISEGGTKECARCAGSRNGTLPCDQVIPYNNANGHKYASCPDDEIFRYRKYFFQSGLDGLGRCNPITCKDCVAGAGGTTTWKFPGGVTAPDAPIQGGNLVFTKLQVVHPNKASAHVGAVLFKRLVAHKTNSTEKADVTKVGVCVKCKQKIYGSIYSKFATTTQHTKLVSSCLKDAMDAQGELKSGYECTGNDAEYFSASLKAF